MRPACDEAAAAWRPDAEAGGGNATQRRLDAASRLSRPPN